MEANQTQENQSIFINMCIAVRATAIYVGIKVKNTLIVLGTHIVNETVRLGSSYIVSYIVKNVISWSMKKIPEIVDKLRDYGFLRSIYNYIGL
tara:strand:+ start:405 stop:683 length:279 start_codon:yes stop_codon:yes gene_type:complete